jgi:hypothetical protein
MVAFALRAGFCDQLSEAIVVDFELQLLVDSVHELVMEAVVQHVGRIA